MPNIADVLYVMYDTEENIQKLYNAVQKSQKEGNSLIYHIIEYLGIDTKNMYLRGTIVDVAKDYDSIELILETAWDWQPDFLDALKSHFKNMEIYFSCEEPGLDLYVTNSFEIFPSRYIVDNFIEIYEYFDSFNELKDYLQTDSYLKENYPDMDFSKIGDDINEIKEIFKNWNQKHNGDEQFSLKIFKEI